MAGGLRMGRTIMQDLAFSPPDRAYRRAVIGGAAAGCGLVTVALNTDAIQSMRLEQADCGRVIQAAALETLDARMRTWRERGGEPPFSVSDAARLLGTTPAGQRSRTPPSPRRRR